MPLVESNDKKAQLHQHLATDTDVVKPVEADCEKETGMADEENPVNNNPRCDTEKSQEKGMAATQVYPQLSGLASNNVKVGANEEALDSKDEACVDAQSTSREPEILDVEAETPVAGDLKEPVNGTNDSKPLETLQDQKSSQKNPASKARMAKKPTSSSFSVRPSSHSDKPKKQRNELTHLIPGYTAPMRLSTSKSFSVVGDSSSLEDIRQKAMRDDNKSRKLGESVRVMAQRSAMGNLSTAYQHSHASFHTKRRKRLDQSSNTAGSGWFNMRATPMTEEIERDMALIRNRNYLDPKRFYKSADKSQGGAKLFVQRGTVIEGPTEYYSSRLTKKQRRSNLVDEVMAEPESSQWTQQKYQQMQQQKEMSSRQWGKKITNRHEYKKKAKR